MYMTVRMDAQAPTTNGGVASTSAREAAINVDKAVRATVALVQMQADRYQGRSLQELAQMSPRHILDAVRAESARGGNAATMQSKLDSLAELCSIVMGQISGENPASGYLKAGAQHAEQGAIDVHAWAKSALFKN